MHLLPLLVLTVAPLASAQTYFTADCNAALTAWRAMRGRPQFPRNPYLDNGCTLPGVFLTFTSPKRIYSINWQDKGLSGTLSPAIGSLKALSYFYLNGNQVSGPIPESIGNLAALTELNLGLNKLTGSIPASIGNLQALRTLDLTENQLTGSIPESIGNLTGLTKLALSANQLSGPIPSTIGNLKSLRHLWLDRNQLSGPIPDWIGSMTSLTWICLHRNNLTGSIPWSIGNLRLMYNLWLHGNKLSGSIPESIGNLTAMKDLRLFENQLTGPIPASIGNLKKLNWLLLHRNQLSGSIPSSIGGLTAATQIAMYDNKLTGSIPSTVRDLTALTYLSIEDNQLSGDPSVLSSVPKSATLRIYPNAFTSPNAPPQVVASNMNSSMLAAYLAAPRGSLLKRQQTSAEVLRDGENDIQTYCPLNNKLTKEIVAGCLKGLLVYCSNGSPQKACHTYYDNALLYSIRYSQLSVNCPPWRNGPVSQSCTNDLATLRAELLAKGYNDTDVSFPKTFNDNMFKNASMAPCKTDAYPGLKCAPYA